MRQISEPCTCDASRFLRTCTCVSAPRCEPEIIDEATKRRADPERETIPPPDGAG